VQLVRRVLERYLMYRDSDEAYSQRRLAAHFHEGKGENLGN
jgi:hypothetical protein